MKKLTESDLIETCVFATEHPELVAQGVWRIGYTVVNNEHSRSSNPRDEKFGHLHLCIAGSCDVLTDRGWRHLQPGQAYVCPPGKKWEWRFSGNSSSWQVLFVRLLAKADQPLHYPENEPYVVENCKRDDLSWVFRRLCGESANLSRPTVIHHLGALIRLHCREIVCRENTNDGLGELWSDVLSNLAFQWTIDKMAELSGLGKETLRKKCLEKTGRSPMKHLSHLRMQHAGHLLLDMSLTLDEVACAVGYSSQFSFSKAFLAHTGLRPATFRRGKS